MAKPRVPKKTVDDKTAATPVKATSNDTPAVEASGRGNALNGGAKKTVRKKAAPKPMIVKSEARQNVVPINLEAEVRQLAYLMAERRGFEPGHEVEDWFAAEREVHKRYHRQSA